MMPARSLLFLLALVLFAAGCKSADELYNEGQTLELQGRYEEAARHYADALEKEPGLRKAQGRLLEAGKLAVGQRLTRIDEAEAAGDWVAAADAHRGLDDLVGTARDVGVTLPLPADYAEQRRANFEAAITTLLDEGEENVRGGRFAEAVEGYERARRYDPTADDRAALADAALDAYTAWAEADLSAGQYRAALAHAEQALALAPPNSAFAAELRGLQNAIIDQGSVRTAAAPLWRTADAGRALPDGLLDALNDELVLDHWTQPPPFVLTLEPALVRRGLRDLRLDRQLLRTSEAADLGRALDVDAVVAGEIDRFERSVTERERETREARTRDGGRTPYIRVEDEVSLTAVVTFEVVDARARRAVCDRDVAHTVRGRIARGEANGSIRDLSLDRDERRLFDTEERVERERELERELLDGLADRVADAAFECLLREVP